MFDARTRQWHPVAIDLIERRRERRAPGAGPRWQARRRPSSRSAGHAPQHQQSRGARRIGRAAASWRAHRSAARGDRHVARQHRVDGSIAATLRRSSRFVIAACWCSIERVDVGDSERRRSRVAGARRASRRQGTCYSLVQRPRRPAWRFQARIPQRDRDRSRHQSCYWLDRTMDAGPNITIASPRQLRRADRRAGLDLLLRHVASDLVNAIRSPQPVDHPHRAARAARARAQHRTERDLQHDAAAIAAADSRA